MSKPPRLTLPSDARAYLLATARGEFAVHEAGAPVRGTALLVPGYTGSKEDFIGMLEPLAAAGYRVVAVDGRGQHESPGPREESAYTLEELARDVLAQAGALGAAGPLHLLGHSLGGLVVRTAVVRDPAPFASLALLSTGPGAVCEDQRGRTKLLVAALEAMGRHAGHLGGHARPGPSGRRRGLPRDAGVPARAVAGHGPGAADRHRPGADIGARPDRRPGAGGPGAAEAGAVGGQRPGLAGVGDGRHGPAPRRGAGGDPGYGALAERRGAGRDGGGAGRVLGGLRAVTPSGR
ncbi:alpha/beta fold hydrolase [Streptomyces goshikiensis]|uniref:alpha/beta fold hydrolase n=1 Tax=Streptomyces goshikiensis TaxID=1942 RepID=UPI003615716D